MSKLYIDARRFQIDVSDAPIFKLDGAMYPVYYFESELFRHSVQEQPQWEDYLRSKLSRLIDQLNSIHNMMWVGIELSDEGKFVYGDDVLDTVNEFDFVYFSNFSDVVEV
jgi:hypothetical protein